MIKLTPFAPVASRTEAPERIDLVLASGPILARILGTLVNVCLALGSSVAWHTDTLVAALLVQAGALIHARIDLTLVDVDLATSASEASWTFAPERAGHIDTRAAMFTGRTGGAFVIVNGTIGPTEARRAGADGPAIDRRWVTGCIGVTRVVVAAVV